MCRRNQLLFIVEKERKYDILLKHLILRFRLIEYIIILYFLVQFTYYIFYNAFIVYPTKCIGVG